MNLDNLCDHEVAHIYDALGGYLIAKLIISKQGSNGLEPWLKEKGNLECLIGSQDVCHPLAEDIFSQLVSLIPRQSGARHMWQFLEEPYQRIALLMTLRLEGKYLDSETVSAFSSIIKNGETDCIKIFPYLCRVAYSKEHPLNANFLDKTLQEMSIADRDLCWSEWIRKEEAAIKKLVDSLTNHWKNQVGCIDSSDYLNAKWTMWLLLIRQILSLRPVGYIYTFNS